MRPLRSIRPWPKKNVQLLSWPGAFLVNRLVWLGAGMLSLVGAFALFPMSAETLGARSRGRRARKLAVDEEEGAVRTHAAPRLPVVSRVSGGRAAFAQLVALTRIRGLNIVREVPFWAIAFVMLALVALNGREAGHFRDTAV